MYAVIENGGRQYKVTEGQRIALDKFISRVGDKLVLDKVMMVADGDKIETGTPFIKGMAVEVEVVGDAADSKIIVFKRKRRKNYRRTYGHRQKFTVVVVKSIRGSKGISKTDSTISAKTTAKTATETATKTATKTSTKTATKTVAKTTTKSAVKKPVAKKPATKKVKDGS